MNGVIASSPELAALRLAQDALGQGFHADALYCYHDAEGVPLFWRARLQNRDDGAKWIRPIRLKSGQYVIGEPLSPPKGKPLYRLPEVLAATPAATVWVVEGEACADALAELGIVSTTSGGSSSAEGADWTPLRGRNVVIWPDNDAPGRRYAEAVAECLSDCRVQIVDIDRLCLPDKGDCVDWLNSHPAATRDDLFSIPLVQIQSEPPHSGGPRLILTRGSDVQPQSVDWLWPGWLAAGKMHLIGGQPGTGKTTLATALAATVTNGGLWPDGARAAAGDVVIWSGEDDNADTLNPRFRAANADMSRIHVISGMEEDGSIHPFDPARDIEAVGAALLGLPKVRLIVIDPIVSAVGADTHKNGEVRRSLQPLVDLAARHRCALLGITHFSKGTSGREPVERITGSLAFGALARLVMVAAKQDAIDGRPERRVLMRAKSNIGADGGGFVYELQQEELPGYAGVVASRVQWGASIEGSARELLSEAESMNPDRAAADEAQDWLRFTLEAGPVPAGEVIKLAKLSGIADKALRTARERIGIKPKREGFGKGGRVIWSLPPIDDRDPHRCRPAERASMQEEGIYAEIL